MDPARLNLEADVALLVSHVGQKENRFRLPVQVPGMGAGAGPAITFIGQAAVDDQISLLLDA